MVPMMFTLLAKKSRLGELLDPKHRTLGSINFLESVFDIWISGSQVGSLDQHHQHYLGPDGNADSQAPSTESEPLWVGPDSLWFNQPLR